MVKFCFSNGQLVRREVARTTEYRRALGGKVMSDRMLDSRFLVGWSKDVRKFLKQSVMRGGSIW